MASRIFFDPVVALRVAPLVSSTCTLLYARDQQFFFGHLNTPENRRLSRPVLKGYFKTAFDTGLWLVLALWTTTTATSVANLYHQRAILRARGSFWWYTAGAVLATAHLSYVPLIAPSVKALLEATPETDVNEALDEWLSVNWLRSVTVDLGAWVALTIAVVKTLQT